MLTFETAIGTCGLTWSEAGLTGVFLPRDPALGSTPGPPTGSPAPAFVADAIDRIQALLADGRADLTTIPLDGTLVDGFRQRVLEETRKVGAGELTTYGAIARTVGTPQDARAVGTALGSNPWPIVVPCHRVVAADGALTGFSAPGGVETKRRMLEIENAPGFDQPSLFG